MADTFISYSRKDSAKAIKLAEQLRERGFEVWIDQQGLEAATSWSKEIVEAIESSAVFILLLSRSSLASDNVVKELSLASESHRVILPVQLEPVVLPTEFKYQLAGLQHAQYGDTDSIVRVLTKIGAGGGAAAPAGAQTLRKRMPGKRALAGLLGVAAVVAMGYFWLLRPSADGSATRLKKLAVLPFESLSGDKDNEYFADGMTATLIDMLVPIPELSVVDRKTSMEFKSSKQDMKTVAAAIGARYIVDGTIQRQGDRLQINAQMTDVESGKILFSKTFGGSTQEFLNMQEQIAKSIVVELQLAFNPNGIAFPPDAKTANPEAYNLCLKANFAEDHYQLDSAIAYYRQAGMLDPHYAFPYLSIARIYGNKANNLENPAKALAVVQMDSFFAIGKRLDTASEYSHFVGSWLATVHGDFEKAIQEAALYLKKRPTDYRAYRVLGLAYINSGRPRLAADNFIEDVKRNPMGVVDIDWLLRALLRAKDTTRLKQYANQATQLYEAWLVRHPDDVNVSYRSLPYALSFVGRSDDACQRVEELLKLPNLEDGDILFAAAINSVNHRPDRAIEFIRRFIAKTGIREINFKGPAWDNLRTLPAFKALEDEAHKAKASRK